MYLSECPSKSNNLQLLRFLASVLVILSHSFAISTGSGSKEWLDQLTHYDLSMGGLAVSIFFCAGGYLIAKSMERVGNGKVYFRARILRIFPALMAVVLICTFVLGPIATSCSIPEYFQASGTYKYLLNGFLILQHNLPGVFTENPYAATINGSLWTLPVEFLCYVACYLLWKMKFFKQKTFVWTIPMVALGTAGLYVLLTYVIKMDLLLAAIRPALLFYMGILFWIYKDKIKFTKIVFFLSILIILVCNILGIINVAMVFCFPYVLFYICFILPQISDTLGKTGNISYGIYLCAFPIQQTIVMVSGGVMSPYLNMLLAVPLSILFGWLVYHFVEHPAIKKFS